MGMQKDKKTPKNLAVWDSKDRDKIEKEQKAGLGEEEFWKCGLS